MSLKKNGSKAKKKQVSKKKALSVGKVVLAEKVHIGTEIGFGYHNETGFHRTTGIVSGICFGFWNGTEFQKGTSEDPITCKILVRTKKLETLYLPTTQKVSIRKVID